MSEERTLLTQEEVEKGLSFLNIVYQAAIANSPVGLIPEALKVQQEGITKAAQNVVDLIEAHGPLAKERAKMFQDALQADAPKDEG